MRKILLSTALILLAVGLFAQFPAPEIQSVRTYFYPDGGCGNVIVSWTIEEGAEPISVNAIWDDEVEEAFLLTGHQFIYADFTQDMVHTIGVQAVYSGGTSEITTLDIYLSNPFYPNPSTCTFTPDYDAGTAFMQWQPPETAGGEAPEPILYDIYLNGELLANTPDTEYVITDLTYGESYYVTISTGYSDGRSSIMLRPQTRFELYFHELEPAADVNVDNGLLSWSNPGQGDIIGGSIMHAGAPILWPWYWPSEQLVPASFGDGDNSVQLYWSLASWIHEGPIDHERIWVDNLELCGPTLQAASTATSIDQLSDVSTLTYGPTHIALWDKDTSPDGFGDFAVFHNSSTGCYGVLQHIDNYAIVETPFEVMQQFNAAWWYQTNGSADFSEAPRYFPQYYNIYLDDELVDTVCYELITVSEDAITVVDEDLYPDTAFEYGLEDLIPGQSYEVGIEAVYIVGKSPIETYQFTYHGSANEGESEAPAVSNLLGNYPNPFNPETTIEFSVGQKNKVELDVYNIRGQKVRTLFNEVMDSGQHKIVWDGRDDQGESVSSGIYFCKMSTGSYTSVRKMILMK